MTLIVDENVWRPRIVASAALNPERFVIVLRQPGFDDEFSVMLEYDARFEQPWSRTEADGAVEDVSYGKTKGSDDPVAFALTNEGEVFTLIPGAVQSDKIIGAGLNVEDADGRGQTFNIVRVGMITFVTGLGKQLYRKDGDAPWVTISADKTATNGYLEENFGNLSAIANGGLIFDSHQKPGPQANLSITDDPRFSPDMPAPDLVELMRLRREEEAGGSPITRLYHFSGEATNQLDIPSDIFIRGIRVAPDGKIWIVGVDGLIMRGTIADGFERIDFVGDQETLIDIAWVANQTIVAGASTLNYFNGHLLSPLKPKLDPTVNDSVPVPSAIYGFGEVLMYIDYKHGVSLWDGDVWTQIEIPQTLLARSIG